MEVDYTVIGRLKDILEIYPVDRGSIWHVQESLWQAVHEDYQVVRNPERKGHYGLAAAPLVPADSGDAPAAVPMYHGHSRVVLKQAWYHLPVKGVSKSNAKAVTYFDVWHRYPMPWDGFVSTGTIQLNWHKRQLSDRELKELGAIELRTAAQTKADYKQALRAYQANPAWRKYFPPMPRSIGGTNVEDAASK